MALGHLPQDAPKLEIPHQNNLNPPGPRRRLFLSPAMQLLPTALCTSLLTLGLGAAALRPSQEEALQEETPVSARAARLVQLDKDLQGTWKLEDYQVPNEVRSGDDALNGWMMVRDGYLSWTMFGSVEVDTFFGSEREANLEALLFQYRLTQLGQIQMASLSGFSDLAETNGLVFDDGRNAHDYDLTLSGNSLTLDNPGVETFVFRRLRESTFPRRAIQALESQTDLDDEDDVGSDY